MFDMDRIAAISEIEIFQNYDFRLFVRFWIVEFLLFIRMILCIMTNRF